MYLSEYTGSLRTMPEDFTNILNTSRKNNPVVNITGILFYDQGKFIQIIEGEKSQLDALMGRLNHDTRHSNIQILIDSPIESRELENWNMEAFDISSHVEKDWSLLIQFRESYLGNFKVSTKQIISWLRHFVRDHDKVKRMNIKR